MNMYLAEVMGTAMLILLGDGVVANVILTKTKGNSSGWIVITMGWATAVYVPAVIFGAASGAHFNPALTLALAIGGNFPWANVPGYVGSQFLGAFIGAVIVWLMYKNHFDETTDPGTQLGVFSTGPAIRNPLFNLISEIIGTFFLVFAILGVGSVAAPDKGGTWAVWAIILAAGVSLGGTTGYAINPARDLGPRIAHALLPMKGKGSSDWGYAWIPVVGPVIGAVIAAVVGGAIF
jgi:glycerol uptake facilitator protein